MPVMRLINVKDGRDAADHRVVCFKGVFLVRFLVESATKVEI
jgi:hypothetical protein